MKKLMESWRKYIAETEAEVEEAKNKDGKEQGADGKACWKGYRYDGTEDGEDKCVPMEEELVGESDCSDDDEELEEGGGKCTKVTKKASSDAKGKKWTKCVKDGDGYKRIHWGQKGVRVTGDSGDTKRKKSFRARHNCDTAKANTPRGQACKDW